MSGLAEVVAAVDPSLAPYAVSDVPAGEWEARIDGDRAFTMEAVYEGFLMHYREPRAFSGMDADLRLLAETPCTRSGSSGSPRPATSRRWPSWPT